MVTYGCSTGLAPTQVSNITVDRNTQKFSFFVGLNLLFIVFFFTMSVSIAKIDITIATTPPSLEGIARRIA